MPCNGRLAEFTLHITNLIYFCGGVAILTVGAIGLSNPSTVDNGILSYVPTISILSEVMYLPGISLGPSIYLTCMGSMVIILSFLGCGGAFKRSRHIVLVFGLITLLLMLFNVAVVMFYVIDPYFIQDTVAYNMNITLTQYFEPVSILPNGTIALPSNNLNADAWITMQFEQTCCGINSYQDYRYFNWSNTFNNTIMAVPPSCCMQIVPSSSYVPTSENSFIQLTQCLTSPASGYAYLQGCIGYVMEQVTRYNFIWAVVAAGLAGLQGIILALTMWLLVIHFDKILGVGV